MSKAQAPFAPEFGRPTVELEVQMALATPRRGGRDESIRRRPSDRSGRGALRSPDRYQFASQADARLTVFGFIQSWYNPNQLCSALGLRSSNDYEKQMRKTPRTRSPQTNHRSTRRKRPVLDVLRLGAI